MKFNPWPLRLQYFLSFIFVFISYFILWCAGRFVFRIHIKHRKSLRRQFKQIIQQTSGPLIICPNHLTYIDSPIIQMGIASLWTHISKFYACPWNLPKKSNVSTSWFFQMMCYLGKCVLLPDKKASEESKLAMNKIQYLLQKGQYILLFPEGTRSETGRVNNQEFTYGAGQLLLNVPQANVLCVYIRGDHQLKKSNFPAKGDQISISLKLIKPKSEYTGLRAARDLSRKIVQTITDMEQEYFATQHRQ